MWLASWISGTILALFISPCHCVTIELNGLYGEFSSPGYPQLYNNDEDVTWVISTDPGYQIVVYFSVFNLEDSYDDELGGACVYDYVEVEKRGVRKRLCGDARLNVEAPKSWEMFRSESNSMIVRFVSDYSNEVETDSPLVGFAAHYRVEDKDECKEMDELVRTTVEGWDELVYCNHFCINVPGTYYCSCRSGFELHENKHTCSAMCANTLIKADEGVIESPDYPKPYARLTDCDWTIQVEEGKSLNIQFDASFAVENHPEESECVYDWIKVTLNGEEQYFCHNTPYDGSFIQTNLREVRLDMHTDNALEESGFRMTFNTTRTRCLEPRDAPRNGRKSPNPKNYYEFEDEIQFACSPGYDLTPTTGSLLICQSDGTWNKAAPSCKIKECGEPPALVAVPNSHIVNKEDYNFTFGDVITVECDKWYELVSGIVEWKCTEDAAWTTTTTGSGGDGDIPVCNPICGVKNQGNPFISHIARGAITEAYEWPWMAFLNFGSTPNLSSRNFCGGTLIHSGYVLTAAHCVTSMAIPEYLPSGQRFANHTFVWLGAHDRQTWLNKTASLFHVSEVIRHPSYDHSTYNYDYALLRLSETVVMGDKIRPVCIPSEQEEFQLLNPGSTRGWVAGWGYFEEYRVSYLLMHTRIPTVNNTECWQEFKKRAHSIELFERRYTSLTDKMFCAGDKYGNHGATCQGDSGGSFVQKRSTGRKYYVLGLVSYGLSAHICGQSKSYTGFAKIDETIAEWIKGVIENTPT